MKETNQKRMHDRWELKFPILFSKPNSENLIQAKMFNISEAGMYFESGNDIGGGSEVCIWMGKKPRIATKKVRIYEFYRSRIRWSRELENGDGLGVGVQHIIKTIGVTGPDYFCTMCGDKIPVGKVHFEKDFLYLCPSCHSSIRNCSRECREEIFRMLEGNVF